MRLRSPTLRRQRKLRGRFLALRSTIIYGASFVTETLDIWSVGVDILVTTESYIGEN
jgi:hypothetical protein